MNFIKLFCLGKDYIFFSDENAFSEIEKINIKLLCDRHKGIGADGILAIKQNSAKNSRIKGFLQNGEIMQDFSTAAICAAFAINSKKSFNEQEFTTENHDFFTVITDFGADYPLITCDIGKCDFDSVFPAVNRKTELGNRILTLTAMHLHGIHTVHFSECMDKLDINYLGKQISENSLYKKQADLIIAEKNGHNSFRVNYYENKTGNPRPAISALGACAAAACKTDNAVYGEEIRITVNNNTAYVFCSKDGNTVIQCTATETFRGHI